MNSPDLLQKYIKETGSSFELLDKMLDFTKTNLEVLKYVEWLENREPISFDDLEGYLAWKQNFGKNPTDYIQETANNVVKLRFINEVKSRMNSDELLMYLGNIAQQNWVNTIPDHQYADFLKEMDERSFPVMYKDYAG
jgi:hypothetical protein